MAFGPAIATDDLDIGINDPLTAGFTRARRGLVHDRAGLVVDRHPPRPFLALPARPEGRDDRGLRRAGSRSFVSWILDIIGPASRCSSRPACSRRPEHELDISPVIFWAWIGQRSAGWIGWPRNEAVAAPCLPRPGDSASADNDARSRRGRLLNDARSGHRATPPWVAGSTVAGAAVTCPVDTVSALLFWAIPFGLGALLRGTADPRLLRRRRRVPVGRADRRRGLDRRARRSRAGDGAPRAARQRRPPRVRRPTAGPLGRRHRRWGSPALRHSAAEPMWTPLGEKRPGVLDARADGPRRRAGRLVDLHRSDRPDDGRVDASAGRRGRRGRERDRRARSRPPRPSRAHRRSAPISRFDRPRARAAPRRVQAEDQHLADAPSERQARP